MQNAYQTGIGHLHNLTNTSPAANLNTNAVNFRFVVRKITPQMTTVCILKTRECPHQISRMRMLIWFFAVRVLYKEPVPLVMEMRQVVIISVIKQRVCVKPRQNTRNFSRAISVPCRF